MAKLIFIVNKIPESNDQSYDYFRRWIMLFEKTFQGVDTSLIEELTTREELLGLSNPAIFFLQAPLNYKIVAKILSSKRSNGLGISCPPFFRIPLHLETNINQYSHLRLWSEGQSWFFGSKLFRPWMSNSQMISFRWLRIDNYRISKAARSAYQTDGLFFSPILFHLFSTTSALHSV